MIEFFSAKHICLYFLCVLLSINARGQGDNQLIDRKIFFDHPSIYSTKLSPNGRVISFLREHNGLVSLWIMNFEDEIMEAMPLTGIMEDIVQYYWSSDSKYLIALTDSSGDENNRLFSIDIEDSITVPLISDVKINTQVYHIGQGERSRYMYVGLNERDPAWYDLVQLNLKTGEKKVMFENGESISQWYFDSKSELRLVEVMDQGGFNVLYEVRDYAIGKQIFKCQSDELFYVEGWDTSSTFCYLVTNANEDLLGLYKLKMQGAEIEFIERDPLEQVDFDGLFLDKNTGEILYTSYSNDYKVRRWKNSKWEDLHQKLIDAFPGRQVSYLAFDSIYDRMVISVWGDKYASEIYTYVRSEKKLKKLLTERPKLKDVEHRLCKMEGIRYLSKDGLEINGYLSLPRNQESAKFPLVVLVHGGPKGIRDSWGYDPYVQLLTNRGYAVLQPNFRGSGGYGKEFMNAGDGEWGRAMQDDITWGVKCLIDSGLVDSSRVAIMGDSYGGYAALAGLSFTPDLYACGVDMFGPSNLISFLESVPAYWEAYREYLYRLVGDPRTIEGRDDLKQVSPFYHTEAIKKPLLIIHGANDPRVKKRESESMAFKLKSQGTNVTLLIADDEGHGFEKPINNKSMWLEVEKFLERHLGGLSQKEDDSTVIENLEKIRVDLDSFEFSSHQFESIDLSRLDSIVFMEGDYEYDVTLKLQSDTLSMHLKRSVSFLSGEWIVCDQLADDNTSSVDSCFYDHEMKILRRSIKENEDFTYLTYFDDSVSILGEEDGQTLYHKVEGILLDDGPGFGSILGGMNLEEGEVASTNLMDIMYERPKEVLIKYEGKIIIDGLEAMEFSVTPEEDDSNYTMYWVDDDKNLLKMIKKLPLYGGMTIEVCRVN